MNRIATTIITLVSAFFIQSGLAVDPEPNPVDSRLAAIEARLEALEKNLAGDTGSYSYQDQATLDATRGDEQPSRATYVIQSGDTLGSIARKHNVERSALLESNRLSEGQPIYIGETLIIPGSVTNQPTAPAKTDVAKTSAPPLAPAKEKSVVVGKTDSAPASKTHVVVKGDTLTSMARQYGTDVNSIKSANGLKTDVISLGQRLMIPSGSSAPAPKQTASNTNSQDADYQYENPLLRNSETYGYYTVRKGDNLYALARDFFSNMGELQRLNRLGSSTLIYPGDDLIVPTSKYNAYHVNGDVAKR
jgi:LysM repeat protein